MVTGTSTFDSTSRPSALPGRRFDSAFFSTTVLLLTGAIAIGFARTYYLAGLIHAPLPSRVIHIHAVVFTSWMLLLIAQASLVATGNVRMHQRLGIAGVVLACIMIPLGLIAATDTLVRHHAPPGADPLRFYIIPVTQVLLFGFLVALAIRARKDAATHKRFMLLAVIALALPGIARWPAVRELANPLVPMMISWIFLLMLAGYDLWSMRRLHRATWLGSALLMFVQIIRLPLSATPAWHAFAAWIQNAATPWLR